MVLTWISLCSIPLFLLTLYLAWHGQWLVLGILVFVIVAADKLFQKIARETEVSKTSSSYGLHGKQNGTDPTRNCKHQGDTSSNEGGASSSPLNDQLNSLNKKDD